VRSRGETAQRIRARGDHRQAALHVIVPVLGHGLAREHRLEAPAIDLIGASELLISWPDDANQALPRLTLFVAQRPA